MVAQQLIHASETCAPSDTPDASNLSGSYSTEDCIVFDYLRQSLCTFTLPVFVAERPNCCNSDALVSLGLLASQVQTATRSEPDQTGKSSAASGPLLRRLLQVAYEAFDANPRSVERQDGADGVSERRKHSLASQLAAADARVTGAVELAELRASFASQLEVFQRAADKRCEAEVESRLESLRVREVARVKAEERQRFETQLSQV